MGDGCESVVEGEGEMEGLAVCHSLQPSHAEPRTGVTTVSDAPVDCWGGELHHGGPGRGSSG